MSKAKLPAKPDKAGLQLIIRHMVQAAGKTLADVSRELGHARTYVSTMLRDATTPGLDLFVKIANACGYDVLLVGHGEAHRLAAERIGEAKVSATRLWSVESAQVEGAGTCNLLRARLANLLSDDEAYQRGYDEGFASADDWLAQHEDAMAEHGWVRKNKEHVISHATVEVTPHIDWSRMADELDEFVEIVRGMAGDAE